MSGPRPPAPKPASSGHKVTSASYSVLAGPHCPAQSGLRVIEDVDGITLLGGTAHGVLRLNDKIIKASLAGGPGNEPAGGETQPERQWRGARRQRPSGGARPVVRGRADCLQLGAVS